MSNDTEELDSTNQSTEEVDNTDEVDETDDQSGSEDLEALREKNKRLFERAKKSEAEAKLLKAERLKKEEQAKVEVRKTEPSKKQDDYTLEDVAILVSKVSEKEDREIVKKYAKAEGVSLEDALNNDIVKAILKDKSEKRQTAQATNTSPARRGSARPSAEAILADLEKGKLPEDAESLAEARFEVKKKK